MSWQATWYQKDRVPPPAGTAKVWLSELSPSVATVEPPRPAQAPEWTGLDTTEVVPVRVQPVRSPVSKPPLAMPPPTGR